MDITIKDKLLLDNRLKPQEVYLFLQLVRLCDKETSILTISALDLMDETRFTNKRTLLAYLKSLIDDGYIEKLENIDKKSTYKINNSKYFKR